MYKKALLAHNQQSGGQPTVTLCIMPPRGPRRMSATLIDLHIVGVLGIRLL